MFTKKYHLSINLPNSFVWNGFINVEAETLKTSQKSPKESFLLKRIQKDGMERLH